MTTIRQFMGAALEESREDFFGSAGTGASGDVNRVFQLTTVYAVTIVKVFLDGVLLTLDEQYTFNSTTKQITFIPPVWDDQLISIIYDE